MEWEQRANVATATYTYGYAEIEWDWVRTKNDVEIVCYNRIRPRNRSQDNSIDRYTTHGAGK